MNTYLRWLLALSSILVIACGDDGGGNAIDSSLPAADAAAVDAVGADAPGAADANVADAPPVGADAGTTVAVFQDGMNGYTGTRDTSVRSDNPTTNYGSLTVLAWDGDGVVGLLVFTNMFGTGAGQIPQGSTIVSATLTIEVTNASDMAGSVHVVNETWDESTVTWATRPVASGAATAVAPYMTGSADIDVTASVAAWAANPATNYGWAFETASTDGVAASSREASANRPRLTVSYVAP